MTAVSPSVWIITDQKPGHLNQSLGLAEALKRRIPSLSWQLIPALSFWQVISFIRKNTLPKPEFIIAAGHRTHLSLLLLSKYLHVPSIVLMKPSLPMALFDLCLIPEHDSPPPHANIVITKGALNRIQPGKKEARTGLILVGGPSRHFGWDEADLLKQISNIIQNDPRQWKLTTSRRTPPSTLKRLQTLHDINIFPASETNENWLPEQLAITEQCWVTQDSVSMIYEALTAHCRVGLITTPKLKTSKLSIAIDNLYQTDLIEPDQAARLAEADRCAQIIHQRFLS